MTTSTRHRSKSEVVRSLYPFQGNDGMTFEPGEKIDVTEKAQNGWWKGTLRKKGTNMEGWFPAGFVEIDFGETEERSPIPVANGTSDLPDGWYRAVSSDGKTYYYNQQTQEASWFPPEKPELLNNSDQILQDNNMNAVTPPSTKPKPARHSTVSIPLSTPTEESTPIANKIDTSRRGSRTSLGKVSLGDSSPSPHSSQGSLDSLGSAPRRRKTKPVNLTPVRPNYFNYPLPGEGSDQSLLNSLEVSFCDYFWEDREDCTGFDVVLTHVSKGREICKEMGDFFRKRALMEEMYAANLERLSKSVSGDAEQGTLGRAWQRVKKGLEEEALKHHRLSQTLIEQLDKALTEFSEFPPPVKKEIKKLETTAQDNRKKVISAFKDLEKQKNAYSEKQKQLDSMQSNQSPSKVSDKDLAKAKKKTLAAVDDMKRSCDIYNEAQSKWVEDSSLDLINLENLEKERVEYVKEQLGKYVKLLNSTTDTKRKIFSDIEEKVNFVDAVQDRTEFVQKFATGQIRPVDLKL